MYVQTQRGPTSVLHSCLYYNETGGVLTHKQLCQCCLRHALR